MLFPIQALLIGLLIQVCVGWEAVYEASEASNDWIGLVVWCVWYICIQYIVCVCSVCVH